MAYAIRGLRNAMNVESRDCPLSYEIPLSRTGSHLCPAHYQNAGLRLQSADLRIH